MFTLSQYKLLLESLQKRAISPHVVEDKLSVAFSLRACWGTKEWKQLRQNKLKPQCQICGSTKKLTIQHLIHPQSYTAHYKMTLKTFTHTHQHTITINHDDEEQFIIKNYTIPVINSCPQCNNHHINIRTRKKPTYLCPKCHYTFNTPRQLSAKEILSHKVNSKCLSSPNSSKKLSVKQAKYHYLTHLIEKQYSDEIKYQAIINHINDMITYLSMEYTITACNRCAFNYDINRMDLCPVCKNKYKPTQYRSCIFCLPEDKRKMVLEAIAFKKELDMLE